MRRSVARGLVATLLLLGCGQGSAQPRPGEGTPRPAELTEGTWSTPVEGLSLRVDAPRVLSLAAAGPSPDVEVGLRLRNASARPLRVYWLREAFFRANSTVRVLAADGQVVSRVEPPPPHGMLATEADFLLLAPGAEHAERQRIPLAPWAAHLGPARVEWRYRNGMRRWPGGQQTLDGPTRPLFGGADVPHLFVGEAAATTSLALAQ